MENYEQKTLKNLKLVDKYIKNFINKNEELISAGEIEKVKLDDNLRFNLINYLVNLPIKNWKDVIKHRKIVVIKYSGYLKLMLLVAIYASLKYPKLNSKNATLKSLYDLRNKVFIGRHRGYFTSNDVDFETFCNYMKKYYESDLKLIKKMLEQINE